MIEPFDFENEHHLSNSCGILEALVFDSKTKNDANLVIRNAELALKHAKAGLEAVYDLQPNYREEIYNYLIFKTKEAKNIINRNSLLNGEQRLEFLKIFENVIEEVFNKNATKPITKLKVNADHVVLYDLLRQLKILKVRGSENFLPQNNKQLAEFIVSCIEGFENTSVATIERELGREAVIKKTGVLVKTRN